MTLTQWLIFFLAVQLVHGLGTFKLYQKGLILDKEEPEYKN